ncbi:MAG: alkyl sulfatase C-terminal domain-containing protein, partial [Brooklawnia sp.]
DVGQAHRLTLSNGVLTHTSVPHHAPADLTLRLDRRALAGLLTGRIASDQLAASGVETQGDPSTLSRLLAVMDRVDPDYAIVTP